MKRIILINLIILVTCSCSSPTGQKRESDNKESKAQSIDTLIGKKNITNEIAGSAYRKRATGYFTIVNKDTSDFMPIFSEYNDNGKIGINLNLPYLKNAKTYFQRLSELELILPEAALEYNFDSLRTVSIGRLILSGDLAISVTKEYKEKFGNKEKIITSDYKEISEFLLAESTLAKDLNELLKPYSKSVSRIDIEKAFFTDKDELLRYSEISRDTTEIPEKILDFITWINIKDE